jgi:putative transposase
VIIGIDEEGIRNVLAFSVGERENQTAWEDLLENLKERGVAQVDLWITNGNKAMTNAIDKKFTTSKRLRCVVHKMENVLDYIPEKQQDLVKSELGAIIYQTSCEKADQEAAAFIAKYEKVYPTAVDSSSVTWKFV